MTLSVVIVCWNDLKVIADCLESIFEQDHRLPFEVIVSDNGSSDGCVEYVRSHYPQVQIIENGENLGFAKANNVGIRAAVGEYILILNPDTIVHDGALDKWIRFAEQHPDVGAFGCRVLNADGTFHKPAQVFPTIWRYWVEALFLRRLARLSSMFQAGEYANWDGMTEREIDWQSGCCVLFRGDVLRELQGFDERFFYNFEETDLCKRVWDSGRRILYTPEPVVTHLWGQSTNRFPIRFALEKLRNRYRYFHKHYGVRSLAKCKRVTVAHVRVRQFLFRMLRVLKPRDEALKNRLTMYRVVIEWNKRLDPLRFIQMGEEPDLGYAPLAPAPRLELYPNGT